MDSRFFIPSFLMVLFFGISSAFSAAQNCAVNTTPALSGQSWADQNAKTVYIDPSLPQAIQQAVTSTALNFSNQTGQPINVLAIGAADPGAKTQDVIRFLNDAGGSPTAFAHTATSLVYSATGVATSSQVSATTSFNVGYQLAPATKSSSGVIEPAVPAYDPNQPNASTYLIEVVNNELGHAFGLKDTPVPTDPNTGQPSYALQPAGASIMNGSVNTNDRGPHVDPTTGAVVNGGVGATSVQPCDKSQINSANPLPPPTNPSSTGSGGGAGNGGSSGGGPGGGGGCGYYDYEDWDDDSNTLTNYSGMYCSNNN